MKRVAFPFFGSLVLLLSITAPLLGGSLPAEDELRSQRSKRRISGSRAVEISPVTPSQGISAGLVMAYGHIIKPPYQVTAFSGRVFINGVQVQPSLLLERHDKEHSQKKPSSEENRRAGRAHTFFAHAERMFATEHGKIPDDELKKKILNHLQSRKDIMTDVTLYGWSNVCYRIPGERVMICDSLRRNESEDTAQSSSKQSLDAEKEAVTTIERQLNKGNWVIFGESGLIRFQPDRHEDVRHVMAARGLSAVDRFKSLEKIFGDAGFALDVIDNFRDDEWRIER